MIAGRKWGKSLSCLIPVVDGHGPGGCFRGAARGARGLWAAPNYGGATEIWAHLKNATRGAWVEKHEGEHRISLPGGGSVTVRSADDPDSLRGPNYDFVVMDEAAQIKEEAWSTVLRQTLMATGGWSIFITTPRGTENWIYRQFNECESKPGWSRWRYPSSSNPLVPPSEIEALRNELSSFVFAQECLAEFVTPDGGLFKRQDATYYRLDGDEYVFADGTLSTARDMQRFLTVDTATSTKTSADHTSIAAYGVDPRGRLVALDLDLARIEGAEIMRRIVAMCRRWECVAYVEENATSKHLLSLMEAEGIPFRTVSPGSQDKWTRAQDAVALWERHRVVLPERAAWLAAFERQLYNFAPKGSDDDSVDTLAYAARIMRDELSSPGLEGVATSKNRMYLPPGTFSAARPPGF